MKTYKEAKSMYENSRKRKLQNNTYLVKTENGFGIRLHDTVVVEYLPDRTILNSGGWKTSTTKNRINEYMPKGWFLYQTKGVWFIDVWPYNKNDKDSSDTVVFADGCYFERSKWYNVGKGPNAIEKQRKATRKYAKEFTRAMFNGEVPKPSSGDCWYCVMVVSKPDKDAGKPLGEACKDKDHILHHIEENYFVPSLLVNACKMFGVSNAAWWCISDFWSDDKNHEHQGKAVNCFGNVAKQQIESAIRRYCYRQLGLAS